MIEITHTSAEGTLIAGTSRGDGAAELLKAEGCRWWRAGECWYIPASRDRAPKRYTINALANALRAAGFEVSVSVDAGPRDMAQVEADRAGRLDDRADALAEKAQRKLSKADALSARSDALSEARNGSPILVGHHSERRARRDQRRIETWSFGALDLRKEARRAADASETAARHMERRHSPRAIASRIERLETERRGVKRRLEGYSHTFAGGYVETYQPATGAYQVQLEEAATHLDEQISYWRAQLDAAVEAGAKVWGPEDFKPGDLVKISTQWHRVIRVNKKTLTVNSSLHPDWTDRTPYTNVTGHKSASVEGETASA